MRFPIIAATCILPLMVASIDQAPAEPTDVEVRVMARGAKFLGGYAAPVRVLLTDADTGEILARGLTAGTTGDTGTIMAAGNAMAATLSSKDSAVFRTTLEIDRPRRVTLSVTGPLSQPQATTTATSTQWILPGHPLTAGDGWRMELPGLIVDLVSPAAYRRAKAGAGISLLASVTMLCGCAISSNGPWRADMTEVEAYVTVDGGAPRRYRLDFDPETALFGAAIRTDTSGLYEVDIRAWMGESNNAGVAHTAFFVD
ncbi:hypothetical protein QSH18_07420 [Xanthomonas sp. NCPPB 2654]|uniref:hypothetical protein n=1 Tax=unclassified Xanthomonas TaxID=2643310 RepID=UPI0021E0E4C2|nr:MULTISPECIES: hypothetical protein [unclassified Xanthomonas]MDL5365431.1 hypothetical protein [Xanthomonas sp. NCPPB 2654]UYC20122.1 hypothetical protein NUG20_18465 [Xanthomonas sp. CFBP 8443]